MASSGNSAPVSVLHPRARGLATLVAGVGTVLINDPFALALFWFLLFPLLVRGSVVRAHTRFVAWILLPITAALLLVWGIVVGAPPGSPIGSAPAEGLRFAAATAIRLAVLGGLWQLCLLTLRPNELAPTLRAWGLRGDVLVVALGSLAVIPDLSERSRQVLSARYARGFLGINTWWARARQFPAVLPPLIAWVLRASIQRSENWRHRGVIRRFDELETVARGQWSAASICIVILALSWFVFGLVSRLG